MTSGAFTPAPIEIEALCEVCVEQGAIDAWFKLRRSLATVREVRGAPRSGTPTLNTTPRVV